MIFEISKKEKDARSQIDTRRAYLLRLQKALDFSKGNVETVSVWQEYTEEFWANKYNEEMIPEPNSLAEKILEALEIKPEKMTFTPGELKRKMIKGPGYRGRFEIAKALPRIANKPWWNKSINPLNVHEFFDKGWDELNDEEREELKELVKEITPMTKKVVKESDRDCIAKDMKEIVSNHYKELESVRAIAKSFADRVCKRVK